VDAAKEELGHVHTRLLNFTLTVPTHAGRNGQAPHIGVHVGISGTCRLHKRCSGKKNCQQWVSPVVNGQ
jgi:hypothetical protein